MDNNYFSIDGILAENQKIQCNFKVDIPDMGHLTGGSDHDIKSLSKAPIPIWLAYIMLFSDWADFTIPTPFGTRVRNMLKAEPRSVKLCNLIGTGGLWYGFGKMITDILSEEQANGISEVLTKAFKGWLLEMVEQVQHFAALDPAGGGGPSSDTAQSFREGHDGTERELFALAQESTKRMKRWHEGNDKARR
ncbi:uncharacterized protein EDB91DRAFT_1170963 [Suillus paluster]|uniref:uncharacterized protein n=1 Tax=Suillus paluster TaxID=48578 RepID=UPI001B88121F|nr:uncharacterized protein EDB91DRAFT_1170963 [Suillus paluster]KAG1724384.1 hypothetical protein EDB91DRAFT_1170963 [Suillus paluster]